MHKPSLINMDEVRTNLQHPDAEIRQRAVKDLVSCQDPSLISDLNQLAREETDVQVRYEIRKKYWHIEAHTTNAQSTKI